MSFSTAKHLSYGKARAANAIPRCGAQAHAPGWSALGKKSCLPSIL